MHYAETSAVKRYKFTTASYESDFLGRILGRKAKASLGRTGPVEAVVDLLTAESSLAGIGKSKFLGLRGEGVWSLLWSVEEPSSLCESGNGKEKLR